MSFEKQESGNVLLNRDGFEHNGSQLLKQSLRGAVEQKLPSCENGDCPKTENRTPKTRFNMQEKFHATTILTVQKDGQVAMGGDGQVTLGSAVMKADAMKIRKLLGGKVLCGFAGSSADAFALLERFEQQLKDSPNNIARACIELAKLWRLDKSLRQLEALLTVTDGKEILLLSGTGDVIQPTDGIVGIGSGGNYAIAAARALKQHSELSAAEIVRESLTVAASIDIYTNSNITVEELSAQ